jgi:hypothetical protein
MRVWQVMADSTSKAVFDDVFFIHKAIRIPQDYLLVSLLHGITCLETKEKVAQLLGKGNGGANCIMQLKNTSSDVSTTLANRKKAFMTEFAYTGDDKSKRINLRGAQFM